MKRLTVIVDVEDEALENATGEAFKARSLSELFYGIDDGQVGGKIVGCFVAESPLPNTNEGLAS